MAIREYIYRIEAGTDEWEIAAKALQTGDPNDPAITWSQIKELLEASFDIVVENTLPQPSGSTTWADIYAEYHNCLVLVPRAGSQDPDMSDEYVIQRSGTEGSYTYHWEYIGCTTADLSNYVQKGTYTTQAASGNTGQGGAATVTASTAPSYTASGTATVTYDKATSIDNHIIAAHSHTVNSTKETITYVSGLKATGATVEVVTGVGANGTTNAVTAVSVDGTETVINEVTADTVSVATEGIKSVGLTAATTTSTGAITYTESITGDAPSLTGDTEFNIDAIKTAELTGTTTFNTDAIKSATLSSGTTATANYIQYVEDIGNVTLNNNTNLVNIVTGQTGTVVSTITNSTGTVVSSATVESNVLKFNAITAVTAVSASTITGLTGVTTGKTDVTVNNGTKTLKYATVTTTTATKQTVGISTTAATKKTVGITGGSYTATTKYVKPTTVAAGTTAVVNSVTTSTTSVVAGITSSTASVLTGVKATGTATVILSNGLTTISKDVMTGATLSEAGATTLSHTINYTTTTVTGTAAVAVSAHTHNVELPNHTHSLSNHTHDINLQNPNS